MYIFNRESISIHAPTRGATQKNREAVKRCIFQSTLPREERRRNRYRYYCLSISIHAPTRGATGTAAYYSMSCDNFNPRSHERSDSNPLIYKALRAIISIHAPTRGATSALSGGLREGYNFNPRSHERSDMD